jgi:MGT family glycosyltransferase
VPDNIHLAPYLPQLDILPHTAAAIVHGGMGTTMEALSFGVPLIVIPQMPEQAMTAQRVADLGLGLKLSREQTMIDNLIDAVQRITSDQVIKNNIATMRQRLDPKRNTPGYRLAADAVEAWLSKST